MVRLCGFVAAIVGMACLQTVHAEPPALRDQVSLNGTWQYDGGSSIAVPHESNNTFSTRTYTRSFQVPSGWAGKTIMIDFEAVNHSCSVFVDNEFVREHIGAFIPFSADITSLVQPGTTCQLKVNVRSSVVLPTLDNLGPVWPIGKCGSEQVTGAEAGMYDDVWLRAYGRVAIIDAFVQTSYREKMLRVDYTVKNFDTSPHTVTIGGEVTPAAGGSAVKTLSHDAMTVAPGDSAIVVCETPWLDPQLWNPDTPNLYHLTSELREGGAAVDHEVRRFGFKEMWIVGNQFYYNGHRLNLYGDNIVESENYSPNGITAKSVWASSIDKLKARNINYARFHSHPSRSWIGEIADEKGFMLEEESALYARLYYNRGNIERVTSNMVNHWIRPWVRAKRNHPSIVMWSAENEMMCYCALLSAAEVVELMNTISLYDPTRPVSNDGDFWSVAEGGAKVYNQHYVVEGGYENTYTLPSIYMKYPARTVPSGSGEFLTSYGPNGDQNRWWHGTIIRGLRFNGWTDIRPYQMKWAWTSGPSAQHNNQKQSWAKVALFDHAYDDLGLGPVRDNDYPSVDEGSTMARRLVVYNDEFSDPFVTITVDARQNSSVYATATRTIRVPLGEHIEVPCTLQAPYTTSTGSTFEMVLRTSKGGVDKFSETRTFKLNDRGAAGTPSNAITLAVPQVTDQSAPFIVCESDTVYSKVMAGLSADPSFISVINAGGGILDNVAAEVDYLSGTSGWLTVNRSGSGNGQVLECLHDATELAAGTYRAALSLSAGNAPNGPPRIGIRMDVADGRDPDNPAGLVPGLMYNAYERDFANGEGLPNLTTMTPVKTGVAAMPTLDVRTRDDDFALRFTGYIKIEKPGEYTFSVSSDEGSRLWIGNTLVADKSPWGYRNMSRYGTILLRSGYHAIAIDYHEESGTQTLQAYWEGPDVPVMQLIPAPVLFHTDGSGVRAPLPRCSPGPFALQPRVRNQRLVVRFTTPVKSAVRIDVHDVLGRVVHAHDRGELDAGSYQTTVRLPVGHYFVRMHAGRTSLLSRVTMVR